MAKEVPVPSQWWQTSEAMAARMPVEREQVRMDSWRTGFQGTQRAHSENIQKQFVHPLSSYWTPAIEVVNKMDKVPENMEFIFS